MQSSSIGFVIGVLVGVLVVFLSFGFGLEFAQENQLNITITIVACSLVGFVLGWLFEGIKQKY